METKFPEHSEVHGPCKSCGKPAVAPIPLHLDATDKNLICGWPTTPLPQGAFGDSDVPQVTPL